MLTDQTRYRLTGLVFLLAVAAVALPMLFDGAGVEPMHLDPLPTPEFEVERDPTPVPDTTPLVEAREELNAAIDEDGYARDTGTRVGETVLIADDAAADPDLKWAVQVASFGEDENAARLSERLRADGYAAFTSQVKQDGELATRVAVGPVIERDTAMRLKTELDRRYDFASFVVRFSP